jgi:RecA/RadA recombinase
MANKKQSFLNEEMKDADLMTILSNNGQSSVFSKNTLIDYSYPTGISVIDYSLGYEVNIKDKDGKLIGKRLCLGIQAGTFNVVTGPTQSFKTTIAMIMAANIASANGGNVIHLDAENRLVIQRLKNMT